MSVSGPPPLPGPASIRVERLTPEAYAPFGWVLGERPAAGRAGGSESARIVEASGARFWHEHDFVAGAGGQVELLWVTYLAQPPVSEKIEAHRHTEQVIIPVNGQPILHIVAPPDLDPLAPGIAPDLGAARAFYLDGTRGVCMRRGTWHMHYGVAEEAFYLMVTRRSTTDDIVAAFDGAAGPAETVIVKTTPIVLDTSGLGL